MRFDLKLMMIVYSALAYIEGSLNPVRYLGFESIPDNSIYFT